MSDFNWSGDDADSVILPHQPRTAVYSGRAGHVVVRQERDAYEEEDPQLVFTPQGALATAWAMIEEAHLIGLPQPSSSLMPLGDGDRPANLEPGLASMARQQPAPAANADTEEPSLLATMNAAAE